MRELRDIVQLLKKEIRLLLIFPLLALVLSSAFLAWQQGMRLGVAQFSLVRVPDEEAGQEEIAYDGYYVIETHRLFGDRLGQLLLEEERLKTLAEAFGDVRLSRVERKTSSDYRVSVRGRDAEAILQYHKTLTASLGEELQAIAQETGEKFSFRIAATAIEFLPQALPFGKLFSGSIALGLIVGLLVVFLREYFRSSETLI